MATITATDRATYAIRLVAEGEVTVRPSEWLGINLFPTRVRILRNGAVLGEVPMKSGDGRFNAGDLGRFQVRYAWVDEDEAASYAPGDFGRGVRECGGLPETVALYRLDEDGDHEFVHEEELGWLPPFRRLGTDLSRIDLATRVEYMDGEIDTLPVPPSLRFPGMRDVAR